MVNTTDIEKQSLEAHVELCAERYKALRSQFVDVTTNINEVKELAEKTHSLVHKISDQRNTQLINWGVSIIASLCAVIAYLLSTHVVFK